jgi:hypothetical protein
VVEAFGTIDALYPGRIDLGLGGSGQRRAEAVTGNAEPVAPRGPTVVEGTLFSKPFRLTPLILSERFAAAGSVLQQPGVQVSDFDDQLDDVIALLGGKFETDNGVHLSATPGGVRRSNSGCSEAAVAKAPAPQASWACRSLRTTMSSRHHHRRR